MPQESPVYDLILLLSNEAPDERREKILADVESSIASAGGSIERRDDWGRRSMSYRIDHQAEADYHLLQFTGPPALLESLSHSLRIADGVLRFRIIKVRPGQPAAPDSAPPIVAPVATVVETSREPAPASAAPASGSAGSAAGAGPTAGSAATAESAAPARSAPSEG